MQTDGQRELHAIFWDMDGTLVDTEPMWIQCEADLMADFGYSWGDDDAHYCIGGPMEKVQQYMAKKSGSSVEPVWFGNRLVEMMLERMTDGFELKEGVHEMLHAAKDIGIKQALVSASRRPIVDAVIEGIGFQFDFSISASEVSISKPHPEGYLTAASSLNVVIDRCVVLEDSATGIRSGLESGALTLGLTHLEFDHANFVRIGDLSNFGFPDLLDTHINWLRTRKRSGVC